MPCSFHPPKLAIDAIGGAATARLAASSADGAVVVNYGLLSGDACRMEPADLIYRGQTLLGFWLGGMLQKIGRDAVEALYASLAEDVRTGVLKADVEAVYGIQDIKAAVAHANKGGRDGKVLVRPGA